MTVALSQILKGSTAQAFRGLTTVLAKAKATAEAAGTGDEAYLGARLFPDMNDLKWQVQMITEFAVRGAARMTGTAPDALPNLPMEGDSFDALIVFSEGNCLACLVLDTGQDSDPSFGDDSNGSFCAHHITVG